MSEHILSALVVSLTPVLFLLLLLVPNLGELLKTVYLYSIILLKR